jgi:hypothetical protein
VSDSHATVHGFWCYAREQEAASVRLEDALHRSLRESLGRDPEVQIYCDRGVANGSNWPAWTVRSIARSILFFWLQSPSSFASTICRCELEMFRAQVARIARRFSVDAGRLLEHWLVPIRWEDMDPRQWQRMGSAPETLERELSRNPSFEVTPAG